MKCIQEDDKREGVLYGQGKEDNSMLYWFPKIEKVNVPYPNTVIQKINKNSWDLSPVCDGNLSPLKDDWNDLLYSARKIGFPLFVRTDEFSYKHNWDESCYVPNEDVLQQHLANIIEGSLLADMFGLPVRAFCFRELIEMDTLFTAFYKNTPINPEYRFFIKDGEVVCWHWYWVKKAISKGTPEDKLPKDWKERIDESIKETEKDIPLLKRYAGRIAKEFEGFWSVDFCKGKDGVWYFIDMAKGSVSYHPKSVDD